MKIKLMNINLCNNLENRYKVLDNSNILSNYVLENNLDFICVQELTKNYSKNIVRQLPNYKIYGKYRYNFVNSKYNECTGIITKHNISKYKSNYLPFIPFKYKDIKKGLKKGSIIPRLYTLISLNINDKDIFLLNVHLDYYIKSIQERELNKLYKIISEINGLVIICGDFNLEISDNIFKSFIDKLDLLNISRLNINDKTNSNKFKRKTAIDHVFISKDLNIIDYRLINFDSISDHKGIILEIDI